MTLENIVTKGEIANYGPLLLLSQCFKIYFIILLSFIEFSEFALNVFKVFSFRCVVGGKG